MKKVFLAKKVLVNPLKDKNTSGDITPDTLLFPRSGQMFWEISTKSQIHVSLDSSLTRKGGGGVS